MPSGKPYKGQGRKTMIVGFIAPRFASACWNRFRKYSELFRLKNSQQWASSEILSYELVYIGKKAYKV